MSNPQGDSKPKHPGGRPPLEFKDEYCKMIKDHMAKGFSFESCAGLLGVHKETLYTWAKKFPQFSDAKREAFELSRLFWEKAAIDNLVNTSESGYDELGNKVSRSKSLNSTAWIFNMKNRFGWRDRVEISANDDLEDTEKPYTGMTKAQALELLQKKKAGK